MTDNRTDRIVLHPSDAHRIRKYAGAEAVDDIEIRPSRELLMRRALRWLLAAALVTFLVPACAVVIRKEPRYFTDGITMTALIASVAVILVGLASVWAWSRTGRRRSEFDTPSAVLGPDGITLAASRGHAARSAPWSEVSWARFVGRGERLLAIGLEPTPAAEPADDPENAATEYADEHPPAGTEEVADASPTPPTVAPAREVFEQLQAAPAEVPAEVAPPVETTAPPERDARGARWNPQLHGTPYVIDLSRSQPAAEVIAAAFRNFTDGRIDLR